MFGLRVGVVAFQVKRVRICFVKEKEEFFGLSLGGLGSKVSVCVDGAELFVVFHGGLLYVF